MRRYANLCFQAAYSRPSGSESTQSEISHIRAEDSEDEASSQRNNVSPFGGHRIYTKVCEDTPICASKLHTLVLAGQRALRAKSATSELKIVRMRPPLSGITFLLLVGIGFTPKYAKIRQSVLPSCILSS